MDRTPQEPTHASVVDAWIEQSIDGQSSMDVVGLFHAAFERLWSHAVTTLGSMTLTAIAERVLCMATTRYPFFSEVTTRPAGDARWKEHMQAHVGAVPKRELIEGARFALIELLTVIGRLTAETLSQELHAAVMAVAASAPEAATPTIGTASPGVAKKKVQP